MVSYIVTGGTGFLGRRVVQGLLDRDPAAIVHVLVRTEPPTAFDDPTTGLRGGERVFALLGDPRADRLGLHGPPPRADHVIHLGTVSEMTGDDPAAHAADIAATRSVIELARETGAVLHHISSVAVAGDHRGRYFEEDFDLGQNLPSPYHRTIFATEKLVRDSSGVRWRIYRPGIVIGDSRTGEIAGIHGPYYFFAVIAALAGLPAELPIPLPDLGATNMVPVDYVADAVVELACRAGLDGRTFHLVDPRPQPFDKIYSALAAAAGAPTGIGVVPGSRAALGRLAHLPGVPAVRDFLLRKFGIPAAVVAHTRFATEFVSDSTQALLRGAGIAVPAFDSYAATLWQYWCEHLDPNRGHPVTEPAAAAVVGTAVSAFAQTVDRFVPSAEPTITRRGVQFLDGFERARTISAVPDGDAMSAGGGGGALRVLAPILLSLTTLPSPAAHMARVLPGLRW
ncbi:SDR family oxidoreductase [Nocardia sp. NPDC005366]|uniref:SDR family oxidoreductase n=1 Tax=Nocardia sp. NPDC005366 TaxID=3156878 RepID=UPI0033AE94F8